MASTFTKINKRILSPDELRIFIKYWIIVLSIVITYLIFYGLSKLG